MKIANDHPDDEIAIEALIWIATEEMYWEAGKVALNTLAQKHAASPLVAEYASRHHRYGGPFAPYEQLLRAAVQHSHGKEVQAAITLTLATYLKMLRENYDESLMQLSCNQRGWDQEESGENLKRWTEIGIEKLTAEAEQLFKTLIVDYGDIKLKDGSPYTIAEVANQQLYELRHLQIGSLAPAFETKDVDGNPIKLMDLRGTIVVLDFGSHSGCGICSALYSELRTLVERFQGEPFKLIGINQGDEPEKLRELIQSKKVTWNLIDDGDAWNGLISSKFAIDSMPTFYVLDHQGIIRGKNYFGVFQVMPTLIDKLLAEKKMEDRQRN